MHGSHRFWSKVIDDPSGCWIWTAYLNPAGYGQFRHEGRAVLAHRHAYEGLIAEIPDGLTLDHLCRTRSCVNPWHLEPVTRAVNTARGVAAINKRSATHCKNGHEFTDENTAIQHGKYRSCRTCNRISGLAYYYRQKAVL